MIKFSFALLFLALWLANDTLCFCFVQCDWFFSSWDEDVNVPVDDESEESTPISSMNEELLAKAESLGALFAL